MTETGTNPERLRSNKIVFFFGAGASAGEGYPVMDNFLDEVKTSFPSGDDEFTIRRREAFETLLTFRGMLGAIKDYTNSDFDNIETLYSTAEMYSMAFPDEEIKTGGRTLKAKDIPKQIALAIWETCRWRPFEGSVHKEPQAHAYLMSKINTLHGAHTNRDLTNRLVFITTNYDILIELAAWKKGIPISYGQNIGFDEFRDGYVRKDSGAEILKLHGSANWFINNKTTVCDVSTSPFFPEPPSRRETYNWPTIQSRNYKIPDGSTPLLVPPTFSKQADCDLLSNVWKRAMVAIADAKLIAFIGYSFPRTDTFVNHLLHVGLLRNKDLRRVLVINPDSKVGDYARTEIFNSIFSEKRLKIIGEKFHLKASEIIEDEIRKVERIAVA